MQANNIDIPGQPPITQGPQQPTLDYNPNPPDEAKPSVDYDPTIRSTPTAAINDRSVKFHVGMGDKSPGVPVIASQLSDGEEDKLRDRMVRQKALDFQRSKNEMVGELIRNSPNGVNQDDVAFISGMNEVDFASMHDAKNIMETEYAKRFIQEIATRDSQRNFDKLSSLNPEEANQHLDVAEWGVARNQISQTLLEEIQEARRGQGWGGYLGDIVGSNIPLAAVRLNNLTSQAPVTSLLPGKNLQQQIEYLYGLTPNAFSTQLRTAANSIGNLALREQFVTAVIQQSDSDAALTTLGAAADLATIGETGYKAAASLVGKFATKTAAKSELEQALSSVLRGAVGASKEGKIDAAKIAGQTGDFQSAAVIHALRAGDEGLNAEGEAALRLKARSINDPRAWFTGGTIDLSKNNTQDFLKVVEVNPELADKFLNGPTVNRSAGSEADDVAKLQEAYRRTISGNAKSIQGNLIDVDSKGLPIEPIETGSTTTVEDISSVLLIKGDIHPADNTGAPNGWGAVEGEDTSHLEPRQTRGEVYHEIVDSKTKARIAEMHGHLSDDGKTFHVAGINAILPMSGERGAAKGTVGIERIRSLLSQIKEMYPTAEQVDGIRVSGARQKANAVGRGTRDLGRVPLPELSVNTERNLIRGSGNKFTVTKAENSLTNTESMTYMFGRANGEGFPNKGSAVAWAKSNLGQYQLDFSRSERSNIVTHGGKWYARLTRDVPDELDNFKNAEVPINDKFQEGFWNGTFRGLLGRAKGQQNSLGKSNIAERAVVVHGNQTYFKIFRELLQPIARLSPEDRERLGTILENNRNFVDRATGERGEFFQSQGEFEQAYHSKYGILPSPKSITAYYSYVQANQLDGMIRNLGWARDKIRLGAKNWKDQYTKVFSEEEGQQFSQQWTPLEFEGKEVHHDIFDKAYRAHDAWVAVRNSEDGQLHVFRKNFATPDQRAMVVKESANNGKVIQHMENGFDLGDKKIQFYVSGSSKEGRISVNGPWKDGGHVINDHKWYVKQPTMKGGYYTGDIAVATAPNEAVAKERTKAFNDAVMGMSRGWSHDQLEKHISETGIGNGMTGAEFAQLFEQQHTADGVVRTGWSKDLPFLHTQSGEQTADRHKEVLSTLRLQENPYNLLDMDRKFAGERNSQNIPALIAERGVKFRMEDGKLVDPLETLTQAAKSMVDVKLKRDYVLKSAMQWASQFQDILRPDNLRGKNSVAQLYNPEYLPSADKIVLNNAENARKSILRFAGSLDGQERAFETFRAKLAEIAYGQLGDKKYQIAENWLLPTLTDPARFARSIAFHLKMGLFSPMHMFLQASTTANVFAISPRAALKGIPAYFPLRAAIINPNMLDHSASVAAKFGWDTEQFKEMYQAMLKSGWNEVHGDQALLDDIANPKLTNTKGRIILDAGSAMSDEGIKVHRITAWATAYQEWRTANPSGVLDRSVEHRLLQRADNMTANMSASNNSTWQRGLLSIPTQFFTYQIRTMEQYLGKTLTTAEKSRLFAVQAAMFGIPTAIGGAVGVWPIAQSVKDSLTANNIPYDDVVTNTVLNGIPQMLLRLASGSNFDVGQRFGPQGIDVGYELMHGQKSISDLFLGASGSVIGDVISTSVPFVKALWSLTSDDPKDKIYPLDMDTFEHVFQNVTSLNIALKLTYAMNTGRWMSKYGITQDEVTPFQAVFMGVTGANLSELNDTYRKDLVRKEWKATADAAALQVRDYLRRGNEEKDDKQRAEYYRVAKTHAVAGGLTPQEWQEALRGALQSVLETRKDSTAARFIRDSERRQQLQEGESP